MASICDFTRPDGTVTEQLLNEATQARNEGRLSDAELLDLNDALRKGQPIQQCATQQPGQPGQPGQDGLSPVVIGLGVGVLGVGAAIALSQNND